MLVTLVTPVLAEGLCVVAVF